MEVMEEVAATKAAVRVRTIAVRLADRFVVRAASASTVMLAVSAARVVVVVRVAMNAAVAVSATSASVRCGRSDGCSIGVLGADQAAVNRLIVANRVAVAASRLVAAGVRVAITAACTKVAICRRFRMIP